MRADLLIHRARHALMLDEHLACGAGLDIAIEGDRIVAVGPGLDVSADRVIDARDHIVMPGLVNLHTHLPMTLLRGVAEDVDLQGFLDRVWAEEARVMDPEGARIGARLGALEALLGGTTTALDMYFHPVQVHEGAVEVGLRHVIGPVFFSFPGPDGLTWEERMSLARAWPAHLARIGGPRVPPALMPHAAFTVGTDHLREIATLAQEQGAIVHTHASENVRENDDTVSATGMRPVAALQVSQILRQRTVLGHGVRLEPDEVQQLAVAAAAVAHCPGSNLKLASGAADIVGYRAAGVCVGLGTDGCSSSNDLDMFAVMRLAANLARLVRDDPAAIPARQVVAMATIEGARALGMAGQIGTLEVGKQADVVLLDTRAAHLVPMRDPYTSVVFSAGRGDVTHVVVAGEVVVDDGVPTRVRAREIIESAEARVTGDDATDVTGVK